MNFVRARSLRRSDKTFRSILSTELVVSLKKLDIIIYQFGIKSFKKEKHNLRHNFIIVLKPVFKGRVFQEFQ